jgi:hypothetical protein
MYGKEFTKSDRLLNGFKNVARFIIGEKPVSIGGLSSRIIPVMGIDPYCPSPRVPLELIIARAPEGEAELIALERQLGIFDGEF